MQYPKAWERFAAAAVDWLLYTVFNFGLILVLTSFAFGSVAMQRIMGFVAMLAAALLIVAYKVLFESGRLQATPGKLVFGLKVVDAGGGRAGWVPVLLRTWPWWAFFITAITQILLVGYWVHGIIWLGLVGLFATIVLPPGGRCLHDITAGLHVVKAGPGMVGR
ncbi:MAG: RDD family protein [Candidatus Odyssella sp.]|nr:RDD family protein [Candidatus Odyssella sp.]